MCTEGGWVRLRGVDAVYPFGFGGFAVQKPREQVADAEALLDLTRTLVGSVRSLVSEGITPAEFVGCLLKEYGQSTIQDGSQNSIDWRKLGLAVSPIFMKVQGCCTM